MQHPKPMFDIPQVRVINNRGIEIARGYYVCHINRQVAACGDYLKEEDVEHYVIYDGSADWNMPQEMKILKIKPSYTVELCEEPHYLLDERYDKWFESEFGC